MLPSPKFGIQTTIHINLHKTHTHTELNRDSLLDTWLFFPSVMFQTTFLVRTSGVASFECQGMYGSFSDGSTCTYLSYQFRASLSRTILIHCTACFLYQHKVCICIQLYIAKVTAFASKVCFAMLPVPTNGPGIACRPLPT